MKKDGGGDNDDSVMTDLDIECVLSASLSTSSISLGPASQVTNQMSCSAIYQGENRRLTAGSCSSVFITPDKAGEITFNTEDQKGG